MKRTLLLLALTTSLTAARADLVVEQKIESAIQNGTMLMKVKGDKIRVDMPKGPAGDMSSIVDMNTGDSLTLMHGSKMAIKMSGAKTKEMMELMKKQLPGATGTDPAAAPTAPKATGRKEKVGTYNAEVYTWSGPGGVQTLWVSTDFPDHAKLKAQMDKMSKTVAGGMGRGMSPDMAAIPGIVVKTEMEMAGQKFTSTVVSVKEENVDAAIFDAPKDYQEMAQPGIPQLPPAPDAPKPAAPAAPKPATPKAPK